MDTFYGDRCQNSTGHLLLSLRSQSGTSYSISAGQLAGVVVGVILFIVIIVLGVVLIMKKKYTGNVFSFVVFKNSKNDSHRLEEVEDDGVSGFSNPLAVTDGDKDNDNTVTTSHDNHNTDA